MDLHLGAGTAVITPHGELDIAALPHVQQVLDSALSIEPRLLVFDLRDVTFLDSAGLTVLVRANRRIRNADGTLAIANASPRVADVIRRMGLDTVMRVHEAPLDIDSVQSLH